MKKESIIQLFKSLGDKTRLDIIESLKEKSYCLEEMAEKLELTPATLSFHLKKMQNVGLVSKSREQYFTNFKLLPDKFDLTLKEIVFSDNEQNKPIEDDKFRLKVLNTFMKNGRIAQLPKQHKKRFVLLDEILKRFESNKIYEESEVDEIIRGFYDDHCTIRRMMIDEGLMTRNSSKYQKVIKEAGAVNFAQNSNKDKSMMDRKLELKRLYKETKPQMGVMKIECLENGEIFIEAGQNIPGRFNRYKFELKHGAHQSKDLQSDWNKFGSDSFRFELLEELKDPESDRYALNKQLEKLKEKWLDKLQPFYNKGYLSK